MKKALLALLVLILSGCSEEQTGKVETESKQQTETAESTTQPPPAEPEVTPGIVVPVTPGKSEAKKPANRVVINTTKGKITLELFADKAPKTVENFRAYINEGFYDGTIFHRVINGFMIQGGGYDKELKKKPTQAPIANEAQNGLKNVRGSVAMARTSDVESATSQFFINVVDNAFLDHRDTSEAGYGYAVFGSVAEGMEVVDEIKEVPTGSKGAFAKDCPLTDVEILAAKRLD